MEDKKFDKIQEPNLCSHSGAIQYNMPFLCENKEDPSEDPSINHFCDVGILIKDYPQRTWSISSHLDRKRLVKNTMYQFVYIGRMPENGRWIYTYF